MTHYTEIAETYIALWNETDEGRRKAMLAEGWTQDATYVDPLANVKGHEPISGLIGALQQRFAGLRFTLDGTADGHGETMRFSWQLGSPEEPDMIRGTDFARLQGGRLAAVTGFLDKVPASA